MTDVAPGPRMNDWLEQAWLDRYLARQLSETEANWFEAYMLDKPHLVEQIEDDTNLREAVHAGESPVDAAVSASAQAAAHVPQARSADHRSRLNHGEGSRHSGRSAVRPSSSNARWLALAAGLVLTAFSGWEASRLLGPQVGSALVGNPTHIVFDTLRGDALEPRVEFGSANSAVVLVDIGLPPDARSVSLELAGVGKIAVEPSADGFATVLVPREAIARSKTATVRYESDRGTQTRTLNFERSMGHEE